MKRSAIKPSKPLRATQNARASVPAIRPRRCDARKGGCGEMFTPDRQMQKECSPKCAMLMAEHMKARTAEKAAREDRKKTRAELEALKTVPQLKKEAQREFNKYVRLRDAARNCISCNTPPPDMSGLHAGRDAGHYRSTGAADHLRFHEDNCHAQCVSCNQHKAGNVVQYRAGLIWRIGPERVEAVENDNTPIKWTRDGLRAIRDTYKAKAKELEKAGNNGGGTS